MKTSGSVESSAGDPKFYNRPYFCEIIFYLEWPKAMGAFGFT
jgi:hypothetical protein